MEFVPAKRSRIRKRKRLRKRQREHIKLEVRSCKRQKTAERGGNVYVSKEKLTASTMQADAFWKNYSAAQEWQKRHSATWWRSRCFALEYENEILRDKIRALARSGPHQESYTRQEGTFDEQNMNGVAVEEEEEEEEEEYEERGKLHSDEDLEFHVDENMMSFLEQSMRHKIELKQKRELAVARDKEEERIVVEGGAAWVRARNYGAKLLYGDASPRVLAMETALQATVDRHKDRAKPQYWPNIPLRP